MKKIYISLIILLISSFGLLGQVSVVPITSNSVLTSYLQGFGLTITNMSITAAPNSLGFFSGTSSLSFGSGIIMSTGIIDSAIINSPASNFISFNNSFSGDIDLNNICGSNTFDACIIEFDCVPTNTSLLFDFAFASEEYPEFVVGINDVFAILVSGPNPLGGNYTNQNFALIPGSNSPVSIQNVNNGTDNTGPCMNCGYYFDNLADTTSPYDGYTIGLQGLVNVIPGQTYHFKIAIADNADGIYDSGVLLKTYSFRSALVNDILKNEMENSLSIYPNPTSTSTVLVDVKDDVIIALELYSYQGKHIENITFDKNTNIIQLNNTAKGIYFLHVTTNKGKTVKKLVIE